MADQRNRVGFAGRMVIVGFGSIGQGVLPLLLRHIELEPSRITIVTGDERGREEAEQYGIAFFDEPLTRENYRRMLEPLLGPGDFLLNVSVDVSSVSLMELCAEKGALYLDTCIEPWVGGYTDSSLSASKRSNYALRESALDLGKRLGPSAPTAILTHGANPGLVSHFVKQALLDIARDTGVKLRTVPKSRDEWRRLAQRLSIKVIHISERDTQVANQPKQVGEFVNTWSIEGFVSEGSQPSELGWGTHERHFPEDGGNHDFGGGAAIYLKRPGAATRVRSWTPLEGPFHGFLITHGEAISIPAYFTIEENGRALYRPTVHYAYHPCDDAVLSLHELAGAQWKPQQTWHILSENDIVDGIDELGVLLYGHAKNAYWYGSQLSIEETRRLAPYQNATGLQVTSAVLAGIVWMLENPERGIVEADEMDFRRCLELQRPYLGPVVGRYTDWTPLDRRGELFPETLDTSDPWQFTNVLVS